MFTSRVGGYCTSTEQHMRPTLCSKVHFDTFAKISWLIWHCTTLTAFPFFLEAWWSPGNIAPKRSDHARAKQMCMVSRSSPTDRL